MVRFSSQWAIIAALLALLQPQQLFLQVKGADSSATEDGSSTAGVRGSSGSIDSSAVDSAVEGSTDDEFRVGDTNVAEGDVASELPPWDPFSSELGSLVSDFRKVLDAFVGGSREAEAASGASSFGSFGHPRVHSMATPFGSFAFEGLGDAAASPIVMKLPSGEESRDLSVAFFLL